MENIEIQHKLSHNKEYKVGTCYVDGYIPAKQEIIEFAGCFFHFCQCIDYKRLKPDLMKIIIKRRKHMKDTIRFLTYLKYKVCVMWECAYKKLFASNKHLRELAITRMAKISQKYPYKVSAHKILDGVRMGEFQGFVECHIKTPSEYYSHI